MLRYGPAAAVAVVGIVSADVYAVASAAETAASTAATGGVIYSGQL